MKTFVFANFQRASREEEEGEIGCAREREREGGGQRENGEERKVETVQKPTFSTTA